MQQVVTYAIQTNPIRPEFCDSAIRRRGQAPAPEQDPRRAGGTGGTEGTDGTAGSTRPSVTEMVQRLQHANAGPSAAVPSSQSLHASPLLRSSPCVVSEPPQSAGPSLSGLGPDLHVPVRPTGPVCLASNPSDPGRSVHVGGSAPAGRRQGLEGNASQSSHDACTSGAPMRLQTHLIMEFCDGGNLADCALVRRAFLRGRKRNVVRMGVLEPMHMSCKKHAYQTSRVFLADNKLCSWTHVAKEQKNSERLGLWPVRVTGVLDHAVSVSRDGQRCYNHACHQELCMPSANSIRRLCATLVLL